MNNEKILKIEQIENHEVGEYYSCDGYKITTDKQEILILISNGQSCCESWGYFSSNDDFSDFIGSDLLEIKTVDTALNVSAMTKAVGEYGVCDGGLLFVNLETNKGTLQFAAYNSHNGYYGHSAYLISKQLTHETTL